jgi:hypothetical protein
MFKGLFYGTLMSYAAMCDPVLPGKEALCTRMKTNAARMKNLRVAEDVGSGNHLLATWLEAWLNDTSGDDAAIDFARQAFSIENRGFQMSDGAMADWSGTHLTWVALYGMVFLDGKKPLVDAERGADLMVARSAKKGIRKMRDDFTRYRMGLWSVLFSSPAMIGSPDKQDIENMKWRLYETPAPRGSFAIDHRVSASFCMSPYPSLPWKGDCAVNDRTDSLHGYPLFEQPLNVYTWRSGPYDYKGDSTNAASPSFDYLHAYWLARHLGVLDEKE